MTGRSPFRGFWLNAHLLVGTTAGVILAIVGLTGVILAFEPQLLNALNTDARIVRIGGTRLAPPELVQRIERQMTSGSVVTSLFMPDDPAAAVRVSLTHTAEHRDSAQRTEVRYIDPYSGTWQEQSGTRGEAFFRATRSLHRWLLFGGEAGQEAGRQIVGACAILSIGLVLSGLYLRWPRRLSDWRAWMLVRFRLRGRAFLWSLHAVVGTYTLIPILFLALTGLYWTYGWYRATLYNLAGFERRAESTDTTRARPTPDVMTQAWSRFIAETGEPGVGTLSLVIPTTAGAPIEFRYLGPHPAHQRAFNVFEVDAATGAVRYRQRYADRTVGGKVMSSMFAVHTGMFFGSTGSALLMLASLAMPLFAISGWLMYLRRRRTLK